MIDPPPAGTSLHAYNSASIAGRESSGRSPTGSTTPTGAIAEERDYDDAEELPSPVEGGTVTEIACLSLCT